MIGLPVLRIMFTTSCMYGRSRSRIFRSPCVTSENGRADVAGNNSNYGKEEIDSSNPRSGMYVSNI
jgi:hypothetical protein